VRGEEGLGRDEQAVRAIAEGDRRALDVLVEEHAGAVYRFARALVADDAEDVLQETFTTAWQSAAKYRGGSVRAWLLGIARNQCRRLWRKSSPELTDPSSLEQLGRAAGWAQEQDWHERLADRHALERAWPALPAHEREAVALVDLEGFTVPEAAGLAEVSSAAIKSRLHRGRLHLMAILRGEP